MAFVVTFYSYKGGVGRTAALVNTAWSLAAAGQKVLVIDADLEAPGFEEYAELDGAPHPGFLEYATAYAETGRCPDVRPFLHGARPLPTLWVMPAGIVDAGWSSRVNALDWTALHPDQGTPRFVDELRKRIVDAVRPDYVFIDSRTGFSEVAGVTTHQMADLVVLLFRQTRMSLRGTVQAFRSLSGQRSPVTVLPVVSLVPPGQTAPGTLGARRIARVRELLGEGADDPLGIVQIDYDPAAMVAEGVAVRTPRAFPQAVAGYLELVARIREQHPGDIERAVARAAAMPDPIAYLREHVSNHPSSAGQAALGEILLDAERPAEAVAAWDAAMAGSEGAPTRWWIRRAQAALAAGDAAAARLHAAEARASLGTQVGPETEEGLQIAAWQRELRVLDGRIDERLGDVDALRRARRALRAEVEAEPRPGERPSRRGVVAVLEALPPRPGFEPGEFWNALCGSVVFPVEAQARLLEELLDGILDPDELIRVEWVLAAERRGSRGFLGDDEMERREKERRRSPPAAEVAPQTSRDWVMEASRQLDVNARLNRVLALGGSRWPHAPERHAIEAQRLAARLAAVRAAEEAARLDPENAAALDILASALRALATVPGQPAVALLERAVHAARGAVARDARTWELAYNLACNLKALAGLANDPGRSIPLLEEACACLAQAAEAAPGDADVWHNWGVYLSQLSSFRPIDERLPLLREALARSERAARTEPRDPSIWVHAALVRGDLADLEPEAGHLAAARDCLDAALTIAPDEVAALDARAQLAIRQGGEWMRTGVSDCRSLRDLEPEAPHQHDQLANMLLHLVAASPASEWPPLLAEAKGACEAANRLSTGSADYNLACVHARLGNYEAAKTLLAADLARTVAPAARARIALNDPDLAPLWEALPALKTEWESRSPRPAE